MPGKKLVDILIDQHIDQGPRSHDNILNTILAAKTEGEIVVFENESKKYILERTLTAQP